jgi:hypothetical protein
MSQQSTLVLSFTKDGDVPAVLARTRFKFREGGIPIAAERGLYGSSFKWTAGVKALSVLLLRTVAETLRRSLAPLATADDDPAYVLRGSRRTPAASLNDALTKQHAWVFDMFGKASPEMPLLKDLVQRRNPDFNTDASAPVELWLDTSIFPAERIEIRLNGKPVRDAKSLEQLADELAVHWERRTSPVTQVAERSVIAGHVKEYFDDVTRAPAIEMEEKLNALVDGLTSLMDDNVEWELVGPPCCPILGRWNGRDTVRDVAFRNFARIKEHRADAHTIIYQNDTIVVLLDGDMIWTPTAQKIDCACVYRFKIRDGKIIHMFERLNWYVANDASVKLSSVPRDG